MGLANDIDRKYARKRPTIAIIGAGFGGLSAVKRLASAPANVLLIDRDNYHTFSPLLYQVAAAEISPGEIGYPLRKILQKYSNAQLILGDVRSIDFSRRTLQADNLNIPFDYLIVAAGSVTHFFDIPGAEYAYQLKTMEQAVVLRNHILECFEFACHESHDIARKRLLTFIIVGGGPTGIEFAGALSELIHRPLKKDYRTIDFREVRLILIEAADNLLVAMPVKLRAYALKRLMRMNVEVLLKTKVNRLEKGSAILDDGRAIESETVVWTAGVRGNPLAGHWGLPLARNGHVSVRPTLQAVGHENVYVIGDLAAFEQDNRRLPLIAPVAVQEGDMAAQNIYRQIAGKKLLDFRYRDMGTLATIGRNAAVAHLGPVALTGYLAWVVWLTVHLVKLIGFRNRLLVMINWAWDYLFFERTLRIIMPRKK